MYIDLYKDRMHPAELFGKQVLYSEQPIAREEVPEGWHCYDLKGTSANPKRPYELTAQAEQNFAGSILSAVPLMRGRTQSKLVRDNFWLTGTPVTLTDFCTEEGIPCPSPPEKHSQAAEEAAEELEHAACGWVMGMA